MGCDTGRALFLLRIPSKTPRRARSAGRCRCCARTYIQGAEGVSASRDLLGWQVGKVSGWVDRSSLEVSIYVDGG